MRALLYLMGLLYCFLGVAIIADIFMGSIEKITSKTRKVRDGDTSEGKQDEWKERVSVCRGVDVCF